MMANREVRDLIETIRGWAGWRVVETKKGWIAYPPDKNLPGVAIHGTESDHRAMRNTIARLRKAGAPI